MPVEVTESIAALTTSRVQRRATCWVIERNDAAVDRFTSHTEQIIVDGDTYEPGGGVTASARTSEANTEASNVSLTGVITSDKITADNLRNGIYEGAKVTEFEVDWRFPFAGKYYTRIYFIAPIQIDKETFRAEARSLSNLLTKRVGRSVTSRCQWNLGDSDCGATVATGTAVTLTITGETSLTSNIAFPTTPEEDGYYDGGTIEWLTGPNTGTVQVIKRHLKVGGIIELQSPPPNAMSTSEVFTLTAGCNKSTSDCKHKFGNLLNFGGFPFLPGNDGALATPGSI